MGLGSILGKVAKFGLKQIPGVGTAMDIGEALSPVLGGASKQAQQSNILNDRNALSLWDANEAAKLARDKFALAAPRSRLNTSYMASIMDRIQPTTVKWGGPGSGLRGEIPQFEGGYRGAMGNLDPSTKALAQRTMTDALASQLRGGTTGGGMDAAVTPLPKLGQTSTMDKILGAGAFGSGILGALKRIKWGGGNDRSPMSGPFPEGE